MLLSASCQPVHIVSNHGAPGDKSRINECTGREGCLEQYLKEAILKSYNMRFVSEDYI